MKTFDSRAESLSLSSALPTARIMGGDPPLKSCCYRAEDVQPGDVFVHLLGEGDEQPSVSPDGGPMDPFTTAVRRGAAAIVSEDVVSQLAGALNIPVAVVDDSRVALGQVCHAILKNPSRRVRTVGVTGTHGKTTVSLLIGSILEEAGQEIGMLTSMGSCDGTEFNRQLTATPPARELARFLAGCESSGSTHAVVEMTSEALARRHTAGLELDAAVLTNVRRDHLDFHGTVLNYRKAKGRIFDHLSEDGFAVINADDPASKFYLGSLNCPVVTVGQNGDAEVSAQVLERLSSEQTFLLSAGNDTVPVRTHIVGDHHVSNCLLAAAVGLVYGIDLTTIVRGIEAIDSIPGRMQRIERGQPFNVFVDQASNADAFAAAARSLKKITRGRLIVVCGPGDEMDMGNLPLLGRVAERVADVPVLTSAGALDGTPELGGNEYDPLHCLLDGFEHPGRAHLIPSRNRAIDWALSQARTGDTVLIAGMGQRQYMNHHQELTCDREVVQAWLAAWAEAEPVLIPMAAG